MHWTRIGAAEMASSVPLCIISGPRTRLARRCYTERDESAERSPRTLNSAKIIAIVGNANRAALPLRPAGGFIGRGLQRSARTNPARCQRSALGHTARDALPRGNHHPGHFYRALHGKRPLDARRSGAGLFSTPGQNALGVRFAGKEFV